MVLICFTTSFSDRVTQATETLERSTPPAIRDEALRKNLLYVSSAVEIAAGPFPEVNLLDMLVFVRLSRAVLEAHWIPDLYGSAGRELAEVFARSDEELTGVADRALTAEQVARLDALIAGWLADNFALCGRYEDARRLFERLLSLRNDVGLLSEGYDPANKRLLGNF